MSNKPTNTSALFTEIEGVRHQLTRKFTGKTGDFLNKEERSYYGKMLAYYNKGAQRFPYGKDSMGNKAYANVEQEYSYQATI